MMRPAARGSGTPAVGSRRKFFLPAATPGSLLVRIKHDDHLGKNRDNLRGGRHIEHTVQRDDPAEGGERIAAQRLS